MQKFDEHGLTLFSICSLTISFFCNGNIDFNIAIRTMTIKNDIATYPVGGGIVWDSNPIEEWQEAQQKSKIIDIYQKDKKKKLPRIIIP